MKLAFVVHGGVDRGGEERVIPALLWLIERMTRRHEVHVFALDQEPAPAHWELLGAHVHNVGTQNGALRRFIRMFGDEHRRAPFSLVHALFGWTGWYASFANVRYRVPMAFHAGGGELVWLRDIDYGMLGSRRGRAALRITARRARFVTVATPSMQRLAAARGIDAHCIPLGVARDRWAERAPRPRDRTCAARLLHVGDLRLVKDQQTLMNMAAGLVRRGVPFTLEVAGFDTMGGALQSSALAAELGGHVVWRGHLSRPALRAAMEEADLLVVTSRHEAGPIAVLEAAVAGVPTAGTAVGHVDEWAPRAAAAVPVGDANALADAVARLLCDDAARLAMAYEAQRRARSADADVTAEHFEMLYEHMLKTA